MTKYLEDLNQGDIGETVDDKILQLADISSDFFLAPSKNFDGFQPNSADARENEIIMEMADLK